MTKHFRVVPLYHLGYKVPISHKNVSEICSVFEKDNSTPIKIEILFAEVELRARLILDSRLIEKIAF